MSSTTTKFLDLFNNVDEYKQVNKKKKNPRIFTLDLFFI
jgi:hypothetical protein